MGTSTLFVQRNSAESRNHVESQPTEDRAEFVEEPACRNRAARGAITGILLGTGLWVGILALVGVIKF